MHGWPQQCAVCHAFPSQDVVVGSSIVHGVNYARLFLCGRSDGVGQADQRPELPGIFQLMNFHTLNYCFVSYFSLQAEFPFMPKHDQAPARFFS
jgi:hypothetical protein